MRRQALTISLLAVAVAAVAGCAQDARDGRPPEKPDQLVANLIQPVPERPGRARLGQARISTKSGAIQIIEPDGSLTEMVLDGGSPNPFAVTEATLMMLNSNLDLDLSSLPNVGPVRGRQISAQQQALAEFAARSKPLLPVLPEGFEADADMFRGVTVEVMRRDQTKEAAGQVKREELVTVRANLRQGLDANTSFAYATCALAGWAEAHGTQYARHVLTQQSKRNGELQLGAVFTLSEDRPMGLKVMNTGQTAQECKTRGIPAT